MIVIRLTKGYTAILDDIDADIAALKWRANTNHRSVYGMRTVKKNGIGKSLMLHRVLMEKIVGRPLLSSEIVDHIDGDGTNNSRSNLRLCNRSQNQWNKKARTDTIAKLKGVTRATNKPTRYWKAQITVNRKHIYLGYFDTPEEAHEAYIEAAKKYFGEFARAA